MDPEIDQVYLCEVWMLPREMDGTCSGRSSSLHLLRYLGELDWGQSSKIIECDGVQFEAKITGPVKTYSPVPGDDLPMGPLAEVIPLRVMQPDRPQPEKQEVPSGALR